MHFSLIYLHIPLKISIFIPVKAIKRKISMNTKNYPVRTYGFCELAQLYCPCIRPQNASRQLRRWIDYNPQCRAELESLGWRPRRKVLLPIQVACLFTYLGEP